MNNIITHNLPCLRLCYAILCKIREYLWEQSAEDSQGKVTNEWRKLYKEHHNMYSLLIILEQVIERMKSVKHVIQVG
jgi:hypothetical protein